jgi:hypothetical protein
VAMAVDGGAADREHEQERDGDPHARDGSSPRLARTRARVSAPVKESNSSPELSPTPRPLS